MIRAGSGEVNTQISPFCRVIAGRGGPEVKVNYDVSSGVSTTFGYGGQTIYSTGYGLDPKWSGLLVGGVVYLIVIALVLAAAYFILGSIVGVGYAK